MKIQITGLSAGDRIKWFAWVPQLLSVVSPQDEPCFHNVGLWLITHGPGHGLIVARQVVYLDGQPMVVNE